MANEVSICNYALAHIGASPISSFNESSKEAIECGRFYEYDRDSVLRDHNWGFAKKEVTLALLTDEYLGWDYAYAYPVDCIKIQKIFNEAGAPNRVLKYDNDLNYVYSGQIPYEIRVNNNLNSKIILTNEEDAKIIYTAKITLPNLFDPLFIEALSWKIAADLAQPIRGDLQLQQTCTQNYLYVISKATASDSNEGYEAPRDTNSFTNARL